MKDIMPTPTARKEGVMMFAQKKATCVGCKTSIEPGVGNLCTYCIPKKDRNTPREALKPQRGLA